MVEWMKFLLQVFGKWRNHELHALKKFRRRSEGEDNECLNWHFWYTLVIHTISFFLKNKLGTVIHSNSIIRLIPYFAFDMRSWHFLTPSKEEKKRCICFLSFLNVFLFYPNLKVFLKSISCLTQDRLLDLTPLPLAILLRMRQLESLTNAYRILS